jgi:putative endonuclease
MVVYILYSATIDAFYIGQTEALAQRLEAHIRHDFTLSFTRRASDWLIYLVIECSSRKQAVNIEAHIKRMKSRVYLQNLKNYPEIISKLKTRFE